MNNLDGTVLLWSVALKHHSLPVVLKKTRRGWKAFLPQKIGANGEPLGISTVKLCDFGRTGVIALRHALKDRYLAQIGMHQTVAFINLRWALKLPNWSAYSGGALSELAPAMRRAGII